MSTNGTPSETAAAVQPSQRLHPSSLLFSLGSAARRLLIPGIVVLVVNPGNRADLWLIVFFVPAAVGALLKYLSYRYRLGSDELVVREGIVTRNERHIPYGRVQNIDLVQNPVHRLFGVAEVRLETAGGEKPEAVIRVLSLQAVKRMRAHVFRERDAAAVEDAATVQGAAPTVGSPPRRLVLLSLRELLLLGLLSNRGLALAAAAMGLFWQIAPDPDWLEGRIKGAVEGLRDAPQSLPQTDLLPTWALALGGAVVSLLLLKLLSIAWIVLKYYGFTLTRRGDDLRAVYGLLTRVSATIPRHRIQMLSTHRGPLQRWLRRVSVQVETAGGREGDERSRTDRLWLAPQMPEDRLAGLLAEVLPEVDFATLEWRSLEPRARWRVLRKTWILVSLLVLLLVPLLWPWGLLLLLPVPLFALAHSALYVRNTGYAMSERAVLYRSGWLRRRVSVVRFDKIQVVSLRQTPFDRRARMASLCVDTAGAGRIGHPVEINYLADDAAGRIYERLSGEAGRTAFHW